MKGKKYGRKKGWQECASSLPSFVYFVFASTPPSLFYSDTSIMLFLLHLSFACLAAYLLATARADVRRCDYDCLHASALLYI